jgi:hypothetical protein
MNHSRVPRFAAGVVVSLATMACSGNITASSIQVGKTLNSDNSVGTLTTTFKPNDTIYAAILTEGSGRASASATFSYGGRVISEPEKRISMKGSGATEFHIDYSGGFPPGDYDIELFLNGQSVGTRRVRVEP